MSEQPTSWAAPARAGELRAGEVEVWRLELRQPRRLIDLLFEQLSGDEQARARRFRRPRDFDAYVVTRGVLRQLLSAYLGRAGVSVAAQAVGLGRGRHGKPQLLADPVVGADAALEFSVSHSGDFALLAFGRSGALGVDVERLNTGRDIDLIVAHHFAPAEAAALREQGARSEDARCRLFYRYWTRKEAYLKALGVGMTVDLRSFAVGLEPGALLAESARDDAAQWRFYELNPDGRHFGAICVYGGEGTTYLRTMTATVSNSASVQLDL
ncbi:4'-phosphopantetheinyl transferase [Bradymonas sediminis]|nr:4'-phosphopantetheinyl transferase [Bradymonas sediminis]